MSSVLSPRCSGAFVSARARHVSVVEDAVQRLAAVVVEAVKKGEIGLQAYKDKSLFPTELNLSVLQLINWSFLVDAINFNFWTPDGQPKFTVTYNKQTRVGYLAMVAAINRAIAEGKPMYDPRYYGKLTLPDVQHIFRSDTSSQMPLFDERVQNLKEVSAKLIEKYDGCFSKVLEESQNDALKLVEVVAREFPCFRDEAVYEGQKIALYKRAQILAGDLDLLFAVNGMPNLKNVDQLTMFADYRVPQVLLHYGVLKYSPSLMEQLQREHLFPNGSPEEVEIRACSIAAVDRVVTAAREKLAAAGTDGAGADGAAADGGSAVTSVWVDYFLWEYRVKHARQLQHVPYHRTRCIYY